MFLRSLVMAFVLFFCGFAQASGYLSFWFKETKVNKRVYREHIVLLDSGAAYYETYFLDDADHKKSGYVFSMGSTKAEPYVADAKKIEITKYNKEAVKQGAKPAPLHQPANSEQDCKTNDYSEYIVGFGPKAIFAVCEQGYVLLENGEPSKNLYRLMKAIVNKAVKEGFITGP